MNLVVSALIVLATFGLTSTAYGFFVDGSGHYGLRGETRLAPAFSKQEGTYQAIQQSFRMKAEARLNDRSSAFLEFSLFPFPRETYLGDQVQPQECAASDSGDGEGVENNCTGRYQDPGQPGYQPYTPQIQKAYARYAFDWCILEAGRRGRDWGLGIFMDSGEDPFETSASVYDGIDCKINPQKSQVVGFSIGFDKLQESGTYVDPNDIPDDGSSRRFGSNEPHDDLDQYYFSIEFDDREANAGAPFTKHIGVYFAQVSSSDKFEQGGSKTDLKYLDLYTGLFFTDLSIRNEILFRMGKSAAPSWARLGGAYYSESESPAARKLQSIAVAGNIEWTLSRSGAATGPSEYNRGDASRHLLFLDYAYAPGDEDGYYSDQDIMSDDERAALGNARRNRDNNKVEAIEFHRNFKPALLLFNARPESDHLREDGTFNPSRVVNAGIFGLGYRYESQEGGNFEVKLVTASLNEKVPQDLKDFYDDKEKESEEELEAQTEGAAAIDNFGKRPAGYYGRLLGYELDLKYTYKVGREAALGVAAAAALPGGAWQVTTDDKPAANVMLQSFVTFSF